MGGGYLVWQLAHTYWCTLIINDYQLTEVQRVAMDRFKLIGLEDECDAVIPRLLHQIPSEL